MPSGCDEINRFIGGRSRYNTRRRALADGRRLEIVQLMQSVNVGKRGWKAAIAREVGCSRATIGRDIREIGRLRARIIAEQAEQRADDQKDLQMQMAIALRQSGFTGQLDDSDDDRDTIIGDQQA